MRKKICGSCPSAFAYFYTVANKHREVVHQSPSVCEARGSAFVFSLSSHRHSEIDFICTFYLDLLIHNKQSTPHTLKQLSKMSTVPSARLQDQSTPLRVNLNLDGEPITSRTHTHPSHSQTSRLLNSSLSLVVPVSRSTQCIRDV
jgi:hypothetical protein